MADLHERISIDIEPALEALSELKKALDDVQA